MNDARNPRMGTHPVVNILTVVGIGLGAAAGPILVMGTPIKFDDHRGQAGQQVRDGVLEAIKRGIKISVPAGVKVLICAAVAGLLGGCAGAIGGIAAISLYSAGIQFHTFFSDTTGPRSRPLDRTSSAPPPIAGRLLRHWKGLLGGSAVGATFVGVTGFWIGRGPIEAWYAVGSLLGLLLAFGGVIDGSKRSNRSDR